MRYITETKNLWTCDKTMFHAIYNSGTQVFKVINTGSESCYTLPTPIPSGTAVTITVYCLSGHTEDVVTIGGYHNETGNTSWQCDCNLPINIDLSGKSFSHTVITTNTLTDFWIFVYGLVPNNLQFKVQLELGDTATPYVPHGYLPMRRMKYRVNEYCQLLKPNFLSGQSAGVTVTSNGDTFTVNGTSTKRTTIGTAVKNWTPIIGHKILVCGCPEGGGNNTFAIGAFNQSGNLDYGKGNIDKVITTGTWFGILFESGITFNNLIFKPQLFDLTEMYGAGNEPTTVEQFRQDYPNELYEYSPYCWTSMKNMRYLVTTKNLFDSEDWYNTLHAINSTSMTKATVNGIEYYKFRPNDIFNYEYMKGKFKENTVYTFSCLGRNADGTNNRYSGFQIYYTDGTRSLFYINTGEEQKYTVTTLSNKTIDYIILGYNVTGYVLVRNTQLEEGATATPYVPYGYLPLK